MTVQVPSPSTVSYKILRVGLLLGAVGWCSSIIFTFSSWQTCEAILVAFGATEINYEALLDYWLKMTSATFACIGMVFALCFLRMEKYAVIIPLLGIF